MAGTEVESDPDSHTRSIAIFASYFSICIVLLSLCLSTIRFRNFSRARGSWTFTLLTFASLGSTWYHMIAFFMKSYSDWEVSQGPSVDGAIRLGPWLKDVKLFEQAWGTVVEEPARWWWSQQIFLATCGWTVFLAAEGSRRRIRHLWAFMALGQVVAISFVVNLFFLAIVLHDASPPPPEPAPKTSIAARKTDELPSWLYYSVTIPMAVTFMFSFLTPSTIGTPSFMLFLLIPHILLLFVPAFFENLASQGVLDLYLPASKFRGFWRPQYRFCALISAICQNLAFFAVATTLPGADAREVIMRIVAALYDHPAVSSVGWDVIMVGVSVGMWVGVCGGNFGMNVERRLGKGGDWMGAVVGWALMGVGSVGMNALAFGGELGG